MSAEKQYKSFEEFYPFYLGEHSDPKCRAFHYIGTVLSLIVLAMAFIIHPAWFIAVPIAGYSFAWFSHFTIEKNKPATFTYPLWSLMGDYKMFFSWLSGQLPAQLEAAGVASNSVKSPAVE